MKVSKKKNIPNSKLVHKHLFIIFFLFVLFFFEKKFFHFIIFFCVKKTPKIKNEHKSSRRKFFISPKKNTYKYLSQFFPTPFPFLIDCAAHTPWHLPLFQKKKVKKQDKKYFQLQYSPYVFCFCVFPFI